MVWREFLACDTGHVLTKDKKLSRFNLRFGAPLKASFASDKDGIGGAVIVSAKQALEVATLPQASTVLRAEVRRSKMCSSSATPASESSNK